MSRATKAQIGDAVVTREQFPKGDPNRQALNKVVHADDMTKVTKEDKDFAAKALRDAKKALKDAS